MAEVFLVTKNTDFTEGKGAQVPHKIFSSFELAEQYVMDQQGIFGSPQRKHEELSSSKMAWYNGYIIEAWVVIGEEFLKEEKEKRRKEIKEKIDKLELELIRLNLS